MRLDRGPLSSALRDPPHLSSPATTNSASLNCHAMGVRHISAACHPDQAARPVHRRRYCTCRNLQSSFQFCRWRVGSSDAVTKCVQVKHTAVGRISLRQRKSSTYIGIPSPELCEDGAIVRVDFASPKSISLAPDFVSMMLLGFRSRCTTPVRWAPSRPWPVSMPYFRTCCSGSAPSAIGQPAFRLPETP
jgi:hypothetical protein